MAIITTAMALVPPYLTKMLVDDIIPNKNLTSLGYVVISLFSLYLVANIIGGFRGHILRSTGDRF